MQHGLSPLGSVSYSMFNLLERLPEVLRPRLIGLFSQEISLPCKSPYICCYVGKVASSDSDI